MMMKDPPIFVFGPNSFTPSAKIVGNMTDMKKLVTLRELGRGDAMVKGPPVRPVLQSFVPGAR
jgi:hypothetical protein